MAALRGANPDIAAVLELAAVELDGVPMTGGIPKPAGELGFAASEGEPDARPALFVCPASVVVAVGAGACAVGAWAPGLSVPDAVCDGAPDNAPPPAESVSTDPSGSNN
jgi:hypothetical protein